MGCPGHTSLQPKICKRQRRLAGATVVSSGASGPATLSWWTQASPWGPRPSCVTCRSWNSQLAGVTDDRPFRAQGHRAEGPVPVKGPDGFTAVEASPRWWCTRDSQQGWDGGGFWF